jgi:CRP-like cAMP-binding protein
MIIHEPIAAEPDTSQPIHLPRQVFRRGAKRSAEVMAQPDRNTLVRRLRRFQVFTQLADAAVELIADKTRVRVFRAGEYLWRRGMPSSQAIFIEQGLAKTSRRNSSGASRTYGLHGPGESMGIYAICAKADYPTDAVALSEGMTVLAVESSAIMVAAKRFRTLEDRLLIEIGHFTEAFIQKIDIVSAGSIEQRMATLILMLVERYAPRDNHDDAGPPIRVRLPITLTLEHIGEIVDARIETVARVFSVWKRKGWLAVNRDGCDIARLDVLRAMTG